MKREELINLCYKYLADAFDRGTKCSPFDANNSEYELPALHLKIAPNLVDEILLLHPLPDEKEECNNNLLEKSICLECRRQYPKCKIRRRCHVIKCDDFEPYKSNQP